MYTAKTIYWYRKGSLSKNLKLCFYWVSVSNLELASIEYLLISRFQPISTYFFLRTRTFATDKTLTLFSLGVPHHRVFRTFKCWINRISLIYIISQDRIPYNASTYNAVLWIKQNFQFLFFLLFLNGQVCWKFLISPIKTGSYEWFLLSWGANPLLIFIYLNTQKVQYLLYFKIVIINLYYINRLL